MKNRMSSFLGTTFISCFVITLSGCGNHSDTPFSESISLQANTLSTDPDTLRKKAGIQYYGKFQGKEDTHCWFQMVAGQYGQEWWSYSAFSRMPGMEGTVSWGSIKEKEFLAKLAAPKASYHRNWSDRHGELDPSASDHSLIVELNDGVPVRATYVKSSMHFPAIKKSYVCEQFAPSKDG